MSQRSYTREKERGRAPITHSIETNGMMEDYEDKTNHTSGTMNCSSCTVWKT